MPRIEIANLDKVEAGGTFEPLAPGRYPATLTEVEERDSHVQGVYPA